MLRDCRVCKQLEVEGYGEKLYEDHLSEEITGCPMFIKMNTEERNSMVFRGKFCGRCLNKTIVVNGRSEVFEHRRQCKGPDKEFYCQGYRCGFHIWVCNLHAARNNDKMQTYTKSMEDNGLTMGLMSIQVGNIGSINTVKEVNSMDQAISKLVDEGFRQPGCSGVNQPPEGSPMFIFTKCKGRQGRGKPFL